MQPGWGDSNSSVHRRLPGRSVAVPGLSCSANRSTVERTARLDTEQPHHVERITGGPRFEDVGHDVEGCRSCAMERGSMTTSRMSSASGPG